MTNKIDQKSVFKQLSDPKVNASVNKHTYQKPANKSGSVQLTYLQWGWAWKYLMEYDPDATLKFKKFPEYDFTAHQATGREFDFMDTGRGAYVTAILTVKGKTKAQTLPVMDWKSNAPADFNLMQVNKAKQRAFVKCFALFGLGLNLFGLEDNTEYQPKANNGKSSKPSPKQQKTIKWLMNVVGPKLYDGDATKFNNLKAKCGTPSGASDFISWLFRKKDDLKTKQGSTQGRN